MTGDDARPLVATCRRPTVGSGGRLVPALERSSTLTVDLPPDLEAAVALLVRQSQFASTEAAMVKAVCLLLQDQVEPRRALSEAEFQRHLLAAGLMSRLPDPDHESDVPEPELITIEREPMSEMIIRERR